MKITILLLVVFLLTITASTQTSTNPTSLKASVLDEEQLHTAIIQNIDIAKYSDAAQLLETLRLNYPGRYVQFPYGLLHARALALSKDFTRAYDRYYSLLSDPQLSGFVYLPLARISVVQGKSANATEFYADYLTDRNRPDYGVVAAEALDYAILQSRPDDAVKLAQIVMKQPRFVRLGRFYMAKAHVTRKEIQKAKDLLQELLRAPQRDDVASLALTELDKMDGNQLSEEERIRRAKIAYDLWNFGLVKKYLEGLASTDIRNSYYYGRALSFLGDYNGAKKIFQSAIGIWPEDPMARHCLFQYAGVALRQGDLTRAEEIYKKLIQESSGGLTQNATFKLAEVYRAQSRYTEALQIFESDPRKRGADKPRTSFLKARIYFQMNRHDQSLAELSRLLNAKGLANKREVQLWKGVVLKSMGRSKDAAELFHSLANGFDYYGLLAAEQLVELGHTIEHRIVAAESYEPLQLPDRAVESRILELAGKGDILPAFLYLHLYEEATPLLKSISAQAWNLLGVDSKNVSRRYLALAQLAGLSGVYSNANYYSEIFLQRFPANGSALALSEELLKILFPLPYNAEIRRFSTERNLDPFLVLSIMKQESKFKPLAKSPAFARGLMQLIPSTAAQVAADLKLVNFSVDQLYHPEININLGTKYVQHLVGRFGERLELVAASYNGGESNVRRWLASTSTKEPIEFFSNIDLPETRNYVMKVKLNYAWYRRVYGDSTGVSSASAK